MSNESTRASKQADEIRDTRHGPLVQGSPERPSSHGDVETQIGAIRNFALPQLQIRHDTECSAQSESVRCAKTSLQLLEHNLNSNTPLTWESVLNDATKSAEIVFDKEKVDLELKGDSDEVNDDTYDEDDDDDNDYFPQILHDGRSAKDLLDKPQDEQNQNESARGTTATPEARYAFGAEVAIALIVATVGATRLRARAHKGPLAELIPGDNLSRKFDSQFARSSQELDFAPSPSSDQHDQLAHRLPPQSQTHQLTRPKVLVGKTDTLLKIAESFFMNQDVAWLIADLNKHCSRETWNGNKRIIEIKSRQQIELPLQSEVEDFIRGKSELMCGINVITIVEETALGSELINGALHNLLFDD